MYLLLDEDNIVRCMASEECNLHRDKIAQGMKMVEAEYGGICGDKYDPDTKVWEAHPENYPIPTEEELIRIKIETKIREIQRREAIEELKSEGELPPEYGESYGKNKAS